MWKIFILLAVLFCATACKQQKGYVVRGDIVGLPDSIEIILMKRVGNAYVMTDTNVVSDGKFYFKGNVREIPFDVALYCAKYRGICTFRVGNNVTKISGEVGDLSLWIAENDLEEQREENRYIHKSLPQLKEVSRLRQIRNRENRDSVQILVDSIDDVIRVADFELLKQNGPKSKIYLEKLENITHFWSAEKSRLKKEELEMAYRQLSDEQKNSLSGEAIANRINSPKPVQPGDVLPDWELYDLDRNVHRLSDYWGKYILLEFWQTACRACLEERPVLNGLMDRYKDSLCIVGINLNTDRTLWNTNLEGSEPIRYINLSDGRGEKAGIGARYCVEGTPFFVLVSPAGIVLDSWNTAGYTEKHLLKYLQEIKD